MRKNEHPGCSCRMCQYGKRTAYGHYVIKTVNRKLRHAYRIMLRKQPHNAEQIIVGTPFTD